MAQDSILIADTTREERIRIVERSLGACGGSCESCGACSMGTGDPYDVYQPYVDGLKEIREINAEQAASRPGYERG